MHESAAPRVQPAASCLEHYPVPGGPPHRVALDPLPFRVGRSPQAHLVIASGQVSKDHAEIYRVGEQFCLRDLNSTNGTFVNGQRVHEAFLVNGDIVHFAHQEFRFLEGGEATLRVPEAPITEVARSGVPESLIRGGEHLRDMLRQHCVRITFQPVVRLDTARPVGYEALGRGTHSDLSIHPSHLFKLAARCGLEMELSRLFREAAVEEAARLPDDSLIFLNSHPKELDDANLLPALDALRAKMTGGRRIVLEVHEDAVADSAKLSRLREQVKARGMLLAYDDFGSGQARLAELVAAPPDFVKLDMRLVRGIHRDGARQNLVQAINRLTREFAVQVVAEGIETQEEAAVCLRLGCHFGQGFLFGAPQDAGVFIEKQPSDTHLFDLSEVRQRLGSHRF